VVGVAEAVVVVAVVEVEREEWVEVDGAEVDGAIAAVDHRSQEEDMAVVVAGRRAFPVHRALHGQVLAGLAEWLRTGMSEVAI
jgi:hypothetical protein